jgi:hypothetical protein
MDPKSRQKSLLCFSEASKTVGKLLRDKPRMASPERFYQSAASKALAK